MTLQEAATIVGKRQSRHTLNQMVVALSMHSWRNTPDEAARLVAAKLALRKFSQYNNL
jgi:hypothetical protein